MSLNLKHIPCPAGDSCTAFQCIFGHNRDKAVVEKRQVSETEDGEDGPLRKRSKLSSAGAVSGATPQTVKTEGGILTDEQPHDDSKGGQTQLTRESKSQPSAHDYKNGLPTHKEPSSSKHLSTPSHSSTASSAPHKSSATLSKASKPASSISTQKSIPKKETLNPRLHKSAPASHAIRYKLLKLLHEQFTRLNDEVKAKANDSDKKFILNEQQLIKKALDLEEKMATVNGPVYTNVMKNTVQEFKRKTVLRYVEGMRQELAERTQADNDSGLSEATKTLNTGLNTAQELRLLSKIVTSTLGLEKYGYVNDIPSKEARQAALDGKRAAKGFEQCVRCRTRFQVFEGRREEDGALASGGKCRHHWGKLQTLSSRAGDSATKERRVWGCCGGDVNSEGCSKFHTHVFKVDDPKTMSLVCNFAHTPPNPSAPTDRAVAFDCEMAYTTNGMETIRLTATSWPTEEVLLDTIVQPYGEIIDLNSRFSGVHVEDLAAAKLWTGTGSPTQNVDHTGKKSHSKGLNYVKNLKVARDLLFNLISPETILIGHGLENDLNTMRIIHPRIIDTILLFPHPKGLPVRQGLKYLMSSVLGRSIQQNVEGMGHDSAEDARSAGQLVKWSIMKRWHALQRTGWTFDGYNLVAPIVQNCAIEASRA